MVEWLLMLEVLGNGDGITQQQYGPFKSEAACVAAAEGSVKSFWGHVRYFCAATEVPSAPGSASHK
jgi:hypothetical protein